jgi:hypothetical protein
MRVSLGHTNASAEILQRAVKAGATGFTHLGNACPRELDRHDNILWRVFEARGLLVSLIPDRIHVSPPLFRLAHRVLDLSSIYYTADAMSAAGAPPGRYALGGLVLEVGPDQIVRQPGKTNFAGSALRPIDGIFRAAEMLGHDWRDVWPRFSTRPAEWMGIPCGLAPGSEADFCTLRFSETGQFLIIEQVTGNSWSDEVQARIAQPLGMSHTSLLEQMTSPGFAVVDGGFVDATTMKHPTLGGPAGGMQSTGRDLLRFGTALFDGTLLSPESQAAMQAFVPGEDYSAYGLTHGYGLGLEQYVSEAGTVLGHIGTGLHTSFLGYDATTDTLVVVTSNTINSESTAFMALETLAAIAHRA